MTEKLPGHDRVKGTEAEKTNWMNQLVLTAQCAGSSDASPCIWERAGRTWQHIGKSLPYSGFPRSKK
jgi:hypothetical protein